LIVNLAKTWAAQAKYGYSFTDFFEPKNSNTNVHGGELMLGHALTRQFILDGGINGTSVKVHGFRLNDHDRIGGILRARFAPVTDGLVEAAYAHGERSFPRRFEVVTLDEEPDFVFGPIIEVGGGTTTQVGPTQHDRENSAALSYAHTFGKEHRAQVSCGYLDNGSNFDNGVWKMVSAGFELRTTLPYEVAPALSFQYSRRDFEVLEVESGRLRIDNIFSVGASIKIPVRTWLGLRLQLGWLIDQANASRASFSSSSVGFSVNLNPEKPLVWGKRP
jgi:hypothetical protein